MTDDLIIAYLLEELPESDQERFEDEWRSQETWPTEEISVVETDLIDAYLRNQLTPERRQRFERNYLTTEARYERVGVAAALLRNIEESNSASPTQMGVQPAWTRFWSFWSSQTPALRAAAAIAAVAVIAGALWLWPFPPSPHNVASLTLTISHGTRAEGVQPTKVTLPPNTDALKISLTLPEQSSAAVDYRVQLEDESRETKLAKVIEQDARSVLVLVPAEQLRPGLHILKLFAIRTDGAEQRISGNYLFLLE